MTRCSFLDAEIALHVRDPTIILFVGADKELEDWLLCLQRQRLKLTCEINSAG